MSKAILLNTGWTFTKEGHDEPVTLPHTWNAVDGQDGGNDYYRGTCSYTRNLEKPELSDGDRAVLQFDGVAMTAVVSLNEEKVAEHKGGYSTFRVDITDALHDGANELIVSVDNSDNDTVYPQKADFTFYGSLSARRASTSRLTASRRAPPSRTAPPEPCSRWSTPACGTVLMTRISTP